MQQAPGHLDVFHQRLGWKAAHRLKRRARHEHRLVASGDAAPARAQIHQGGNQLEHGGAARDGYIKTAPDARSAGQGFADQCNGVGGQRGVGMQKQQYLTACLHRPGVHLQRPAARGVDELRTAGQRQCGALVAAATVGHNQFSAPCQQRRQRLQGRAQARSFIEYGHDDGKSQCRHGGALGQVLSAPARRRSCCPGRRCSHNSGPPRGWAAHQSRC